MISPPIFRDLVVVEAASVLAGPYTAQLFAELGARVIKIENEITGGDVTRQWKTTAEKPDAAVSSYYAAVNFRKESIFLDLNQEPGRNKAHQILATADILITNFKKGDDEKLGLDARTLLRLNPKLIIGRISGFGPDDDRVAFDLVLQAETGIMAMNGTPESGPLKMPLALIDVLAAHQLREGLLCALIQRGLTGSGAVVDVSLFDAAIASLINQASHYLATGKNPELMGSLHPNIAPYGETFTCADGLQLVLACGNNAQFRSLCRIIGQEELASDPRFSENAERVKNRGKLYHQIEKFWLGDSARNYLEKLHQAGVPAGIVRKMSDVFTDEKTRHLVYEDINGKRPLTTIFRLRSNGLD